MTVAIYARVSTEEQAKSGYSLSEQLREGRKKAGTPDAIEYVDDGFSGEFLDRPALTRLREDIKAGIIQKVICLDPDRLSRKLMNQLIISEEIEKHADLVFVNGDYARTPEGMLFYQMRGAIAEFEKAKINERMSRGRREKARQGRVLRDFQIYGYDFDAEQEKIIINDYEAKVVQLIFDLFTTPNETVQGINGIAKYLTKQGIPTKRGAKQWHRQVVRQLLMNHAYIGEFYQNRWNTEGMLGNKYRSSEDRIAMQERPKEEWIQMDCPSIVEIEQFHQAQQLLSQSRRRWSGKPKNEYLLSGLLRCADCGNTLTGRITRNWGKAEFEYSDIKNTAGAKNKGCGNRISCEELDPIVWEEIENWLNHPEELAAAQEESIDQDPLITMELERTHQEIEKLQKAKQRMIELLIDEELPTEDIKNKLKELNGTLRDRLDRKNRLEQEIYSAKITPHKNLLKDAAEFYLTKTGENLSDEEKKELIRKVVKEIRISKEKEVKIFTI
jgi:site-specific DNA recombinase